MSTQAPWLALAVDWQDSDMLKGATAEERLAWICFLCHAKTNGRAGTVKLRIDAFCDRWQITKSAALSMLDRAAEDKAIENGTGGVVSVLNWRRYQDPKHRTGKGQPVTGQGVTANRGGFTKSAQNDATTNHIPPTTHHSPPTPLKENPKEDSLSARETEIQIANPISSKSPPLKNRRPKSDKSKQAEVDALTLYEAYPIHKGKLAALKAIRKALKTVPMDELLPKVLEFKASEYVQSRLGTSDEQFIKRAATWFNAGSWMDETSKSPGSQWLEKK